MRARSLAATAVTIGVSALAAACGQLHEHGTAAGPKDPVVAQCITPKLTSQKTFTITDTDNGKTFCIDAGTGIFVFLHGTPAAMWSRVQPSSADLVPRPSGVMSLARGVTGGFFGAQKTGTATLSSAKAPCLNTVPTGTSGAHCTPKLKFKVTVIIHGQA